LDKNTHLCFACGGALGKSLFSIPNLPLVDSFELSPEKALGVTRQTIDIRQCQDCNTVQIDKLVDIRAIYENYIYESSSSPDLLRHFAEYSEGLLARFGNQGTVLEIGMNDGLLLKSLLNLGYEKLVGIDPSPQTKNLQNDKIKIVNDFFGQESTEELKLIYQKFDLIIANNCFSHIPNLKNILAECKNILSDGGTIVVEVQSLLDLFENCIFDYIYHEHIFYHSATSFSKLLSYIGLEIYDIEHVSTKGGSYRFYISKVGDHAVSSSVEYWFYRERLAEIHNENTWQEFNAYLENVRVDLKNVLKGLEKNLVGYGASATGTVLMSFFGIEEMIYAIVDDNPKRQGRYSPGSAIPVVSNKDINPTSSFVILSWRHRNLILQKISSMSGKKVIPLPYVYSV